MERFKTQAGGVSGDALVYLANQSEEEWEREFKGNEYSAREYTEEVYLAEENFYKKPKRTSALLAAISAVENIQKGIKMNMVNSPAKTPTLSEKFGYTEDQLELVKNTIAKNATTDELELFFYRCKELQLNPLMPGQIYFIKYGANSPATIVIGIEGFRLRAHATGKISGVKRGVTRNAKGECIGGWADVYRSDWKEPAHEEVPLREYSTGKGNWIKMPESMIKKVAEAAALRMAFPQELGGVFAKEEMEQAEPVKFVPSEMVVDEKPTTPHIQPTTPPVQPKPIAPTTPAPAPLPPAAATQPGPTPQDIKDLQAMMAATATTHQQILQWCSINTIEELTKGQHTSMMKKLHFAKDGLELTSSPP